MSCLEFFNFIIFYSSLGYVAFIVNYNKRAELYSPEGECNYQLALTPLDVINPVLIFENDRIIACTAKSSCWQYDTQNDSWKYFADADFEEEYQNGASFNKDVYVLDTTRGYILNLVADYWRYWTMPPNEFGKAHTAIGWEDSIIIFGGSSNLRGVQTFNVTNQSWSVQNSSNVPFDLGWTSCLLVDKDEILLVGSDRPNSSYSAAKYNPREDTWEELENSELNHSGTRLVKLGSRVFAIDGNEIDTVEEFHLDDNSWSIVETKLLNNYFGFHTVLSLPASLFAHLPGGCKGVR